jgi:hypothetical protein
VIALARRPVAVPPSAVVLVAVEVEPYAVVRNVVAARQNLGDRSEDRLRCGRDVATLGGEPRLVEELVAPAADRKGRAP